MKLPVFIFGLLAIATGVRAQDFYFVNPNQSLVYLNPSFAGSNGGIRAQLNYRNENPALSGRYETYGAAIDAYIKPLKGGLALSVISDDCAQGTLKSRYASLAYAQRIKLGSNLELVPSVQVTYLQLNLNLAELAFNDVINPRFPQAWPRNVVAPTATKKNLDATAGLLITNKVFYAGFSLNHFSQPDIGLMGAYKLPMKITAHASYNFMFSAWTDITISANVTTQGSYRMGQVAMSTVWAKKLVVGFGYRSAYIPFGFMGYRNKNFTAQICYGRNFKTIPGSPFAELAAGYSFRGKGKVNVGGEDW